MGHLLSILYRITKVLIFKLIRINILDISILVFKRREWWTIHSFDGYEYSIIVNFISKYFCTKCICPIGCIRMTNLYPRYDQHKIRIIYSNIFSRYTSKEYGFCFQWTRIATGRQLMLNSLQKSWHIQKARYTVWKVNWIGIYCHQ